MLEGEKNNLQANTRKKKFHCESRCWKKISRPDQITHPPPPQKSNGRPLIISLITRMRYKRDIKMGRLCTPGGAVIGIVGGGVTLRFF